MAPYEHAHGCYNVFEADRALRATMDAQINFNDLLGMPHEPSAPMGLYGFLEPLRGPMTLC